MDPILCPECKQGKHGNCDGIADMDDNNEFIDCACPEQGHHWNS